MKRTIAALIFLCVVLTSCQKGSVDVPAEKTISGTTAKASVSETSNAASLEIETQTEKQLEKNRHTFVSVL